MKRELKAGDIVACFVPTNIIEILEINSSYKYKYILDANNSYQTGKTFTSPRPFFLDDYTLVDNKLIKDLFL